MYSNKREISKDSIAREKYLTSTTVWLVSEENSTFHATQAQIFGAELDKHVFTDEKPRSKGRCSHTHLKTGAQRCIQSKYAERHVSQCGEVHNHESCLIATIADRETSQELPLKVSSPLNDARCVGEVSQSIEDAGNVPATLLDIWSQFLSTFRMGRGLKNAR